MKIRTSKKNLNTKKDIIIKDIPKYTGLRYSYNICMDTSYIIYKVNKLQKKKEHKSKRKKKGGEKLQKVRDEVFLI